MLSKPGSRMNELLDLSNTVERHNYIDELQNIIKRPIKRMTHMQAADILPAFCLRFACVLLPEGASACGLLLFCLPLPDISRLLMNDST